MNADGTALVAEAVSSETPIAPCTGIMVKAEGPGESVTFTKASRQIPNKGTLQIEVTGGSSTGSEAAALDKAIVSFNQGDELAKFVICEGQAKLSLSKDGKDYAIAYSEPQGELPLRFMVANEGSYTLNVQTEKVSMEYLHLIDTSTGAEIDLLRQPSYSFHATGQDPETRFLLRFKVLPNRR